MKRILTYWTFDLTHVWHIRILKRAKELWNYLIVGVSTDDFNNLKWKKCEFPYEHRKEIVESIKYVDLVIPESNWEQKIEDIKKYNIDIMVMWDDWIWKFDYLKEYCDILYLPRTWWISTTKIKKNLSNKN